MSVPEVVRRIKPKITIIIIAISISTREKPGFRARFMVGINLIVAGFNWVQILVKCGVSCWDGRVDNCNGL